jgi:hypothetical protein
VAICAVLRRAAGVARADALSGDVIFFARLNMKWFILFAVVFSVLSPALADEPAAYVFCYFKGNGEDGLHLAVSDDALTWTTINHDRPLVASTIGKSKLMRDPSICRGPDGVFHMVWTTGWPDLTIGYAQSKDLAHWSPQRAIPVMAGIEGVRNCWAPEVFYDAEGKRFVVMWASTVDGRFSETLGQGHEKLNHRLYAFATPDFERIGETKLVYDSGFQVIDGAIFRAKGRYVMVAKNETLKPPAKYLFLSYAASPTGPWSQPGPRITGDYWCEGPSPLRVGDAWVIYFDCYTEHRYGAIRSTDLEHWEDISNRVHFPKGTRHGTALKVPRAIVEQLRALPN